MILLLAGLAKKERNVDIDAPPTAEELLQLQGNINRGEPTFIQTLRGEMRLLHYAYATEKAYVKWLKRFSAHVGSNDLDQFDEADIGDFLTRLAVDGQVSHSTQTQAQSALLFFYECVLGVKLGFLQSVCSRKTESIAVWFSREEIQQLLEHFLGAERLMFPLMYGAGLRHKECRGLRIKDVCFDERRIVVRDGNGGKVRITFLPKQFVYRRNLESACRVRPIRY